MRNVLILCFLMTFTAHAAATQPGHLAHSVVIYDSEESPEPGQWMKERLSVAGVTIKKATRVMTRDHKGEDWRFLHLYVELENEGAQEAIIHPYMFEIQLSSARDVTATVMEPEDQRLKPGETVKIRLAHRGSSEAYPVGVRFR